MKIIKNSLCIATMAVLSFSMVSCENENIGTPASVSEVNGLNASQSNDGLVHTRASGSVKYEVPESILRSFVHYSQRTLGPQDNYYPGSGNDTRGSSACCPTSYMMAISCLRHSEGNHTFPANTSSLIEILGRFSKYKDSNGYYQFEYGRPFMKKCRGYDTDIKMEYSPREEERDDSSLTSQDRRNIAKNFMQNALANNKFLVAFVNAKVSGYGARTIINNSDLYSKSLQTNPDLDYNNTNTYRYILPNAGTATGHAILIIGIEVKSEWGYDGIVTYIDPLAKNHNSSNRRYVRYSRLLDSMISQGFNVFSLGIGLLLH